MCYPTKVAEPPVAGAVPTMTDADTTPHDLDRCLAEMRETLIRVALARRAADENAAG